MLRRSPVLIPRRSERDRRRKIESGLRVMEREREKFEFERERVRENDAAKMAKEQLNPNNLVSRLLLEVNR